MENLPSRTPYVGVTGPVTAAEVRALAAGRAGVRIAGHVPMVGLLVSAKTVAGQAVSNRRYPAADQLPELAREAAAGNPGETPYVTLHFNSRATGEELSGQLERAVAPSAPWARGVQLNMAWPASKTVENFRARFPGIGIIFQANREVLAAGAQEWAGRLAREYGHLIDHVLIDASGGEGVPLKTDEAAHAWHATQAAYGREGLTSPTVGFAGGLCGNNVAAAVESLLRLGCRDFSLDAEGALRDRRSEAYGDDDLNPAKCKAYWKAAAQSLGKA